MPITTDPSAAVEASSSTRPSRLALTLAEACRVSSQTARPTRVRMSVAGSNDLAENEPSVITSNCRWEPAARGGCYERVWVAARYSGHPFGGPDHVRAGGDSVPGRQRLSEGVR